VTDKNQHLVDIPVIDAPDGPLQLAQLQSAKLKQLLKLTHETLPPPLLRWGDKYSAACLQNSRNPYLSEIDEIARILGQPGGYALNFIFEMACTTGCRSPDGKMAMQIYRTLDWPFRLGADVVVARHRPSAGIYFNITWPGYIGVLTALAPGRFAAAINEAPMSYAFEKYGLSPPVDWVVNRWRIRKRTSLPPGHLLRQVFEQCSSYEEAKNILATTPICIAAIFTLTGTKPDEGCIIERQEKDAYIHEGAACITNHWLNSKFKGHPRRGRNSRKRLAKMQCSLPSLKGDFDWLEPPVLDGLTRIAAELNAGKESLLLQGWDGDVPQTNILRLGD